MTLLHCPLSTRSPSQWVVHTSPMQPSLLPEARELDTQRTLLNPPPLQDQGVFSDSDNGQKRKASGDKSPSASIPYTLLWVEKENPSTEKRGTGPGPS